LPRSRRPPAILAALDRRAQLVDGRPKIPKTAAEATAIERQAGRRRFSLDPGGHVLKPVDFGPLCA
jgi:hypothetical protein